MATVQVTLIPPEGYTLEGDKLLPSGLTYDGTDYSGPDGSYDVYNIDATGQWSYEPVTIGEVVEPEPEPGSATTTFTLGAPDGHSLVTIPQDYDPYIFQGWDTEPKIGGKLVYDNEGGTTELNSEPNLVKTGSDVLKLYYVDPDTGMWYYAPITWANLGVALSGEVTIGDPSIGRTTASIPFSFSGTGAEGYQYKLDDGEWIEVSSPVGLSGLTPSTSYTLRIRAYNADTESPTATLEFTTNAAVDNAPDDFTPQTRTDVARSYPVEFDEVTVTGVDAGVDLPVSVINGEYAVSTDGGDTYGAYTTSDTTVRLNYRIKVRHESSDNYTSGDHDGTKTTELDVAGVVGSFTSVTVPDTEAPSISLSGGNQELVQGESWSEPGYEAYDNADGDLTMAVEVGGTIDPDELGPQSLTYWVSDSSGNETSVTRTVTVIEAVQEDQVRPNIYLEGGNILLQVGDTWEEPGYTATDDEDGDITDRVEVFGEVDTSRADQYTLTYRVADLAGNIREVTRTVTVVSDVSMSVLAPDYRTLAPTDDGEMVAETFTKAPREVLDFDVDLTEWLDGETDTINVGTINLEAEVDGGMTITSKGYLEAEHRIKVWLSGGTDGTPNTISTFVTTSSGRRKKFLFRVVAQSTW